MIALFDDVKRREAFLQIAEVALRAHWEKKPFLAQHPDADQKTVGVGEIATEGPWEFGGLEAIQPGTVKAGYAVPIGVYLQFKLLGSGIEQEEEQSFGTRGDLEVVFPDGFQDMPIEDIAKGSRVEIVSGIIDPEVGAIPQETPLVTVAETPEP